VPNFAKIGQSVVVISRFFVVFQDGGRRHLGLLKFEILICITLPNFTKIGQTVAEIWRFNGKVSLSKKLVHDGQTLLLIIVMLILWQGVITCLLTYVFSVDGGSYIVYSH